MDASRRLSPPIRVRIQLLRTFEDALQLAWFKRRQLKRRGRAHISLRGDGGVEADAVGRNIGYESITSHTPRSRATRLIYRIPLFLRPIYGLRFVRFDRLIFGIPRFPIPSKDGNRGHEPRAFIESAQANRYEAKHGRVTAADRAATRWTKGSGDDAAAVGDKIVFADVACQFECARREHGSGRVPCP